MLWTQEQQRKSIFLTKTCFHLFIVGIFIPDRMTLHIKLFLGGIADPRSFRCWRHRPIIFSGKPPTYRTDTSIYSVLELIEKTCTHRTNKHRKVIRPRFRSNIWNLFLFEIFLHWKTWSHIAPLISFLGRSCSKPAACMPNKAWHNTMVAELSDFRRICPYLNTDPVVKLLMHYIGLCDLNRKWRCFAVLAICSKIHSMYNVFMI